MNWDGIFIEVITPLGVGITSIAAVQPIVLEVGTPGMPGVNINPVEFIQASPLATWVINHNLGYKPMVQVFNSGGSEIEGEILHFSINQARVYFVSPVSGSARLI